MHKGKKGTVFGGVAEVGVTIEELLKREAKLRKQFRDDEPPPRHPAGGFFVV